MKRRSTFLWTALAVALGAAVVVVKTEVQELEDRLAHLNGEIASNHEAIHVLRAEWSHLNRPSRMEALAHRYLALQTPRADQILSISELPFAGQPEAGDSVLARRPSTPTLKVTDPALTATKGRALR